MPGSSLRDVHGGLQRASEEIQAACQQIRAGGTSKPELLLGQIGRAATQAMDPRLGHDTALLLLDIVFRAVAGIKVYIGKSVRQSDTPPNHDLDMICLQVRLAATLFESEDMIAISSGAVVATGLFPALTAARTNPALSGTGSRQESDEATLWVSSSDPRTSRESAEGLMAEAEEDLR
jgi:hypothetical protein